MPVRNVSIECSVAPSASVTQRIFSLVLQNVTDFSAYGSDPILGSFLANNTITVVATGDNMPVTIVQELNPGTVNAVSTFKIGNVHYTVANNNATWGCYVIPSVLPDTAYVAKLFDNGINTLLLPLPLTAALNTNADIGNAHYLQGIATNLGTGMQQARKWDIRLGDSYGVFATPCFSTYHTRSYRSSFYALYTDKLVQVVMQDSGGVTAMQSLGAAVLRDPTLIDAGSWDKTTLITNSGPLVSSMYNALPLVSSGNAPQPFNRVILPSSVKVDTFTNKPVYQIKAYNSFDDVTYDLSGDHSVLFVAYSAEAEYQPTISNQGVTYDAVGQFILAV